MIVWHLIKLFLILFTLGAVWAVIWTLAAKAQHEQDKICGNFPLNAIKGEGGVWQNGPDGPVIGWYQGCGSHSYPIYSWIFHNGQRFVYERVVYPGTDGSIPLSILDDNEVLTVPGIVYRAAKE